MNWVIKVEVRLFADLRKKVNQDLTGEPSKPFHVKIEQGHNLEELLKILGIPDDTAVITLVNGLRQPQSYELQNKDRVGLFPPVGGG